MGVFLEDSVGRQFKQWEKQKHTDGGIDNQRATRKATYRLEVSGVTEGAE